MKLSESVSSLGTGSVRSTLFVGIFFFVFFLILFAQFPATGRLPGNTDSLLALTLSNLFFEKVGLFLRGEIGYTALYPARDVMAYGENCYGLASIFLVFKWLSQSDILGYYFFITTIFALNALAVTKLAGLVVKDIKAAVLAGLFFATAGFTLGNMDDPNVVFVFFPVLGLSFFLGGIRDLNKNHIRLGILLSSLQLWFGMYLFAFQFLMLAISALVFRESIKNILNRREVVILSLIYVIPAAPLILLYLANHNFAEVVSPYEVFKDCSLSWVNFIQWLPGNLVYPDLWINTGWVEIRKNCFPGAVLMVFGLIGLICVLRDFSRASVFIRRLTVFLIAIFAVFFILSFGANLPLLEAGQKLPFLQYLRVPSRYYLISLIALTVFAASGMDGVFGKIGSRNRLIGAGVAALIGLGFIVENVPFPLFGYEYQSLLTPSQDYLGFFKPFQGRQILLDLPSTIRFLPGHPATPGARLWFFSREIIYMNWQTYHRQIIAGGANGYVSKTRVEVEDLVQRLPERQALIGLKNIGIRFLVFHKDLVLDPVDDNLSNLRASSNLKLTFEGDREAIFEIDAK
jgi:hypothetical protein